MRRLRVLAVAALAAATLLAVACDRQTDASKGMVGELCRATKAAAGGDLASAGDAFADVHASLHELAAQLEAASGGRAAAARLLEAKQQVEADLASASDGDRLAGDLRRLAGAVGDATEEAVPDSCGR